HTIRCCQSSKDQLLLADNAQGRKGAYKSVSGMPSAQTRPKKSAGKIELNHISVAILQIGYRHSWTFPGRTRQSQISNSGHGLLYQVDRSKTSSNYHRKPSKKVRMGKHSVQIWSSRRNISDNGKQFRDNPFRDWCEKLCIQQHFASVKHPQTNGLVERANRSLGEGIKARLGKDNKNWLEEISHVLWAHRTMIKSSNGDTPFSLTYRTEAVIRLSNVSG
ncbi:reverse transcriptase domain-containing protein, partial [Tanacetum coccineum]